MLRKHQIRIPYDKTSCGTPFNMRAGENRELDNILTAHKAYSTDFFQIFFFSKANGHVILNNRKFELQDNDVLIVSPQERQEWHIEENEVEYHFVFFREDFIGTFISDPFFLYRLLFCYQTDYAPVLHITDTEKEEYVHMIEKMRQEIVHPVADSYHIAVSQLYSLLLMLNRAYADCYNLPFNAPKNTHAYKFKQLLERDGSHPKSVEQYADEMKISRITLNNAVKAQFGVPANHLIKQRLITSLKNDILFSNKSISQLAIDYGFSHPSHLMRFFKGQTGQTITEFRTQFNNITISGK